MHRWKHRLSRYQEAGRRRSSRVVIHLPILNQIDNSLERFCKKCHKLMPLSRFGMKRGAKRYDCLSCVAAKARLSRSENKQKDLARQKARRVLKGRPCEVCANPDGHRHHDDHSKPLQVRWLCQGCHSRFHNGKPMIPPPRRWKLPRV